MTEAEELELLELEEEEAKAKAPREEPSRAESFGRGAAQGLTFDFGDEITGGIQALGQKFLPESLGGGGEQAKQKGFLDLYRESRDAERQANDKAEAAHRGYYLGGNVAGGLATIPLMPGAGTGKTLWQLTKAGAKTGALVAGATGLGASRAELTPDKITPESALQAIADTGMPAIAGGFLGGALPLVGTVAGKGASLLRKLRKGGYVTPTPEAQRLMSEGVDLTLGRMQPDSTLGRVEELASNQASGGSLASARQRTAASARDVLIKKARAPGANPPTAGTPVGGQLDELANGYSDLYASAIDGERLSPESYIGKGKWRGLMTDENLKGAAKTKGAFELAAGARDIDASPAVRERALSWLQNQAESLAPTKSGANAGTVEAKSIQALRTRLRDKIRSLGQEGDDRQLREIYGRAEESVSELLEGQLSPEKAEALRAADASYRNLLSVRDAADKAFVNNQEFTPGQLLMAIRKRGATPELEGLARDAHSVLNATYPLNGVQVAANEAIPLLKRAGPAWVSLANASPTLKAHALGQGQLPGLAKTALGATELTARGLDAMSSEPSRIALIRALALARARGRQPPAAEMLAEQ